MITRHPLAGRAITRMNGAGNKILVLDLRDSPAAPTAEDVRAIHRAPGLDYDQLMTLSGPRLPGTAAYVSIYNSNGTVSDACGNGARCVADRLCREFGVQAVEVETAAGILACERLGLWRYRVDMGAPRLGWAEIPLAWPVDDTRRVDLRLPEAAAEAGLGPAAAVNMGNPHAVFFVRDLGRLDVAYWGPTIEMDPMFPEKANVTFARIEARDSVTARVWERGVGVTKACGSAACATLVAASRLDLMERSGIVKLPGGELDVEWRSSDDHVLMAGPVEFEGELTLDSALFEAAAP